MIIRTPGLQSEAVRAGEGAGWGTLEGGREPRAKEEPGNGQTGGKKLRGHDRSTLHQQGPGINKRLDGECYDRAMDEQARIFRYNGWANERILGAATQLREEQAGAPVAGIYGSVIETARHMLGVERAYLDLMGGSPPPLPENL